MVNMFTAIGIVVCLILMILLFVYIIICGSEQIAMFLYKRKIKRRFKGGPTAKCFCKDCKFYKVRTKESKYFNGCGECEHLIGLDVYDDWFCWHATPREWNKEEKSNGQKNI